MNIYSTQDNIFVFHVSRGAQKRKYAIDTLTYTIEQKKKGKRPKGLNRSYLSVVAIIGVQQPNWDGKRKPDIKETTFRAGARFNVASIEQDSKLQLLKCCTNTSSPCSEGHKNKLPFFNMWYTSSSQIKDAVVFLEVSFDFFNRC